MHSALAQGWGSRAGLTEGEKEEGAKAKAALAEEGGGDGEDGEDGGNYKNKSQFFTHLKKSEARAPDGTASATSFPSMQHACLPACAVHARARELPL